jgi:hypothetical protein
LATEEVLVEPSRPTGRVPAHGTPCSSKTSERSAQHIGDGNAPDFL